MRVAKVSVVIPARLESSRLPGKVLLDLSGKPLLQHVWERAQEMSCADEVVIATDSPEVLERATAWGAQAVMTPRECPNGTSRAACLLPDLVGDFIINLQGDEPFMKPELLDSLVEAWRTGGGDVVTAVRPIDSEADLFNPNLVKVARGRDGQALLFSRAAIPFVRDCPPSDWLSRQRYWAHIGVYGFSREALTRYPALEATELETAEKLEQLRFLEHGLAISVVETAYRPIGVDTQEDLEHAREILASSL
ncbi:3-deoxy-manno-octulosonate cytidylyltransferase [Cerasicoccus arenae]|uniref:3-deoxy-manno-octulosonate cytidylyltransferase n=1 Tax=Cerasicoccus arenae TaxID=424488 RepID=A0A8J3GC74_9BACT|nr:3-deoxy-manno-octulosonate cytidylyltransferase [Cerasicoccus arenae]MBK1857111.1 3-deoxy-manno-octulosonate cytidylyltransferase [Cerasicoccus arenae]GHB92427.1 3-deoxy-manno-octulosonate cytidylyltransferase [Cerasicoccus arenae]